MSRPRPGRPGRRDADDGPGLVHDCTLIRPPWTGRADAHADPERGHRRSRLAGSRSAQRARPACAQPRWAAAPWSRWRRSCWCSSACWPSRRRPTSWCRSCSVSSLALVAALRWWAPSSAAGSGRLPAGTDHRGVAPGGRSMLAVAGMIAFSVGGAGGPQDPATRTGSRPWSEEARAAAGAVRDRGRPGLPFPALASPGTLLALVRPVAAAVSDATHGHLHPGGHDGVRAGRRGLAAGRGPAAAFGEEPRHLRGRGRASGPGPAALPRGAGPAGPVRGGAGLHPAAGAAACRSRRCGRS